MNKLNDVQLIGVTGKKFNGKDTIGNYLISNHQYVRLSFADPLKEALKCIFGFTDEQLYGNLKEVVDEYWGVSPRDVMKYIGTDVFRNKMEQLIPDIKNDIWIRVVERQILQLRKTDPNVKIVITDVRFPNEINLIKKYNGQIIKVNRQSVNNKIDHHESEKYIDSLYCDIMIQNDGSIDDVHQKIKELF